MGIIGRVLHFIWIKRDLEKIFSHRKKVIEDILVNKVSVEKNDYERNAWMKIAVFGWTLFVGWYIIDELLNNDHEPVVLVRKGSESKLSNSEKCEIISGNLSDIESIESTIKGTDAVIYCVGIIREFPSKGVTFEKLHFQGAKECIDIAMAMNIKRFIMMSANGVKVDGTGYQKTKYLAE